MNLQLSQSHSPLIYVILLIMLNVVDIFKQVCLFVNTDEHYDVANVTRHRLSASQQLRHTDRINYST